MKDNMNELNAETSTLKTKTGASKNSTNHNYLTDNLAPTDGLHLLASVIFSRPRSESTPIPISSQLPLPDGPAQRLRRKSSFRSRGYSCGITNDGFEEGEDGSFYPGAKGSRWTMEEHNLFLIGLERFGHRWKKVSEIVKTRTEKQIRSHAQKYFMKMGVQNKIDSQDQKMETEKNPQESPREKPEDSVCFPAIIAPTDLKVESLALPPNDGRSEELDRLDEEILGRTPMEPMRILSQLYDLFPSLALDPVLCQQWSTVLQKTLSVLSFQSKLITESQETSKKQLLPSITSNFLLHRLEQHPNISPNPSEVQKTNETTEGRTRSKSFNENHNYTERIDMLRNTLMSKKNCQKLFVCISV